VKIAKACGFSDQSHLTRAFGQIVGTSPGLWRREHFVETKAVENRR
jgi:AraC-like DNA-binding protein